MILNHFNLVLLGLAFQSKSALLFSDIREISEFDGDTEVSAQAQVENIVVDDEAENDSSEKFTLTLRATVSTNPNDIDFYLYYDKNYPEDADRLFLNDRRSVKEAHFKIGEPVIFVTHGFLSAHDFENSLVPLVKNAYLEMGYSNIIAVDWRRLATAEGNLALFTYYSVMENGVPIVGLRIAKMIMFLIRLKIITGPEMVHLVGHSLGSHASGIAGLRVFEMSGKKVDRITGLDPAGPLYTYVNDENRLDPTDAVFVDAIHTAIGSFGSSLIIGTADFYANGGGGFAQPNCINFTLNNLGSLFGSGLSGICAHSRSYQYFARSILRTKPEFYGCRCVAKETFIIPSTCPSPMNMCVDRTLWGEYVPRTAHGTYYIEVPDDHTNTNELPMMNNFIPG